VTGNLLCKRAWQTKASANALEDKQGKGGPTIELELLRGVYFHRHDDERMI
jgi:hypothetical protein